MRRRRWSILSSPGGTEEDYLAYGLQTSRGRRDGLAVSGDGEREKGLELFGQMDKGHQCKRAAATGLLTRNTCSRAGVMRPWEIRRMRFSCTGRQTGWIPFPIAVIVRLIIYRRSGQKRNDHWNRFGERPTAWRLIIQMRGKIIEPARGGV